MTTLNSLKLFAGNVIVQSQLESEVKHQMLNFVEGGTEHQIKAFLVDGEIIGDPVDLVAYEIIDMRYNMTNLPKMVQEASELISEGPVGSVAGMLIFSPVAWAAWRTASGLLSKKRRYCGTFRISTERDKCLDKYKIMKATKVLSTIKTDLEHCPKSANPEKCKSNKSKAVTKYQEKVALLTRRFRDRWEAGSSAI